MEATMAREHTLQGMLHTEEKIFLPGEMLYTDIDTKQEKTIVTIKQQFWNPTQAPCGLFYFYPLPPNAESPRSKLRIEALPLDITKEEEETWRANAKELPEVESFPEDLYGFALKALQPKQKIIVEFSYEYNMNNEDDFRPIAVLPPLHGSLQMEPSEIDDMLPPTRKPSTNKDCQKIDTIIFELTKDVAEAKRISSLLNDDEVRVHAIYCADLETKTHWRELTESEALKKDPKLLASHQQQGEDYKRLVAESKNAYQQVGVKANSWRDQLRRLEEMLLEAKRQRTFVSARQSVEYAEETMSALLQRQEKIEAQLRESEPGEPITSKDLEREALLRGQAKFFEDSAMAWGLKAAAQKEKNEALYQEALQKQRESLQLAKDYLQQYAQQKQKNEGSTASIKTKEPSMTSFDFVTRFKEVAPVK
jgi:hypothetical protein